MSEQRLTDDERTELVAYLDGELDEEASRAVESRLSLDPQLRAEADALRTAWDLLDYLPRAEPSPSFTHRTLERLTAARATAQLEAGRWRPWAAAAGWAAAVAAAGLVGFWCTSLWARPRPSDEDLARDLRVIEQMRLYEQVDDLPLLRQLADPDLFGDDNFGS